MARYKTGNSVKDRRDRECAGYRNWDTAATCIVVRKNADTLLRMKKNDKLKVLERKSSYGFGGVSYRNVDYKALNCELRRIKNNRP